MVGVTRVQDLYGRQDGIVHQPSAKYDLLERGGFEKGMMYEQGQLVYMTETVAEKPFLHVILS